MGMGSCLPAHADTTNFSEEYYLGDKKVTLTVEDADSDSTFVYINLHHNESTSVDAARAVVAEMGGRLVSLIYSGGRNIEFSLNGVQHSVDPNRIFSNVGVETSLKPYNVVAGTMVRTLARAIRDTIRLRQGQPGVVVGLHNNTNEGGYSFDSYDDGKPFRAGVAKVSRGKGYDLDDFFYVTDETLYNMLVAEGFSVVLEGKRVADDGSLSVYLRERGIAYVNVEAEHGHTKIQTKMIRRLTELIR